MEKCFVLDTISEYLTKEEKFSKLMLISKKINNHFHNTLARNPNYDKKKKFYESIRHSPPCNVRLKAFGVVYIPQTWVIHIYIRAYPIYYEGHEVGIRYTTNNWNTFHDNRAFWIINENNCEIWKVDIDIKADLSHLNTVEFAVYGKNIKGQWMWDNNMGNNYKVTPLISSNGYYEP